MTENVSLRFHNSRVKEKVLFTPKDAKNVRMYVCGPTVYDFAHIGNARPVIIFDILFRLLREVYGESAVKYARNITDVDDKINARAARDYPDQPINVAIQTLTKKTETNFNADIAALNCLPPTVTPRATEHIPEMIEMIEQLITKGFAYEAQGHVLFAVEAWTKDDGERLYGRLANRSLDEMQAGARVEVAPYKKSALDFVLWKPSSETEPGWESPWGRGRPGWHIECSAMGAKHLGKTFDIHGGGADLMFPHHENEIAQSCCAHDTDLMAEVWMHNGMLQVEGKKMSKSLGNFFTIRDLLADWPGEVLRFNMLKTHYRAPIDWTEKSLIESKKAVALFYELLEGYDGQAGSYANVLDALSDDLNTPKAIAELHRLKNVGDKAGLKASANLMGLLLDESPSWLKEDTKSTDIDEAEIEALIAERSQARKAKDFARSDEIRDMLAQKGIMLLDGPNGTEWKTV